MHSKTQFQRSQSPLSEEVTKEKKKNLPHIDPYLHLEIDNEDWLITKPNKINHRICIVVNNVLSHKL